MTNTAADIVPAVRRIPFNRPFLTGRETDYIRQAVESYHLSGNGNFSKRCQDFFRKRYGFARTLLTSSCTDALEMAAILSNVGPGDEVLCPSFTFVSSANAFVLRGAKVVFCDSGGINPNIDPVAIERRISPRTKVIVLVHYAGFACDMDAILAIAKKHNLLVIEDAAHAIDSYYGDRPLGSLGHLATFSFHETKNVIAGEGGMLVVNDPSLWARAEIIWEKGTNRAAFARGEVQKYMWTDIGSSFLPSEVVAAFLFAQLEHIDAIQSRRIALWNQYHNAFSDLAAGGLVTLPEIPSRSTINGHLYYLLCKDEQEREALLSFLQARGVYAVFHYLPLHLSPFYLRNNPPEQLPNAERFSQTLLRLPLFYELSDDDQSFIADKVLEFFLESRRA